MTTPKGLGPSGRALWKRIVAALPDGWEWDDREASVLGLACRQADDLAALERVLADEGVMSVGSAGQPVTHPAVAEARQARLAIGRLLGQLALPDEEAEKATTAAGRHGQQAAETRWRRRDREKRRQEAAVEEEMSQRG